MTGEAAVHAIEPTAQEHGRIVGANMAGKNVRYRGSLLANIVEVCHLDVASFGAWEDAKAEAITGLRADRWITPAQAGCPSGTGGCAFDAGVTLNSGAGSWQVLAWNPSGYSPWSSAMGFVVP